MKKFHVYIDENLPHQIADALHILQEPCRCFLFSPPSKHGFLYWEIVKQIIERWENIKTIFRKNKTPFAYRCSARTPFEKITD